MAAAALVRCLPAAQSVVVNWDEAALQESRRGKLGPPIAARAHGAPSGAR